jgi:hypothetical protein
MINEPPLNRCPKSISSDELFATGHHRSAATPVKPVTNSTKTTPTGETNRRRGLKFDSMFEAGELDMMPTSPFVAGRRSYSSVTQPSEAFFTFLMNL